MSRRRSFPKAAVVATIAGIALLAGGAGALMTLTSPVRPGATSLAVSAPTASLAGGSEANPSDAWGAMSAAPPPPSAATAAGHPASTAGSAGPTASTASTATAGHRSVTPTPSTRPSGGASAPSGPSGPPSAAPGTYRYRQVGSLSGTPAEGTLVVAPGSAPGTQIWTRVVGGSVAPSTSVMLFNTTGSFLVSPGGQVAGAHASCTFTAPLAWPPWPTTPGSSVSGQASCTGPVSSFQVTGRVQSTATMSLDGHQVDTSIVVNTLALKGSYAGSPLNVTLTETDYYAPTLRVPVVTRTHMAGTVIGLTVTTDRSDTLESATPS